MALRILCLLSLLAFFHAGVHPSPVDIRIVNGEDVEIGEIPYQVQLQNMNFFSHDLSKYCDGSLITERHVLTAAHCVRDREAKDINLSIDEITNPKSQHNVVKIIVHEGYDPLNSWIHDIALLVVKQPLVTSPTVGHVPLPPKDFVINANDVAVVSGWGRLWQGGPTTKLQQVNMLIADQTYCRYMYNNKGYNVHSTQVCAYDPQIEKGSCHGDSGGLLIVRGKLVGLVSGVAGCASTSYPTVYTRVASYLDWIATNAV